MSVTAPELVDQIVEMYGQTNANNICLTGGEPFLQNVDDISEVCALLYDHYEHEVEIFTNGTLEWPGVLCDYVGFNVDWKLNGSGEDPYNEVRIKNVRKLYDSAEPGLHAIKFTVANESDLMQAVNIVKMYNLYEGVQGKEQPWIYVGVVWGKPFTTAQLVESVIKLRLDWRINVQLHNYIWDPQERGR